MRAAGRGPRAESPDPRGGRNLSPLLCGSGFRVTPSRAPDLKQSLQLGRRRCHRVRIRNLAAGAPCRSSSRARSRPILAKIELLGLSAGGTWFRRIVSSLTPWNATEKSTPATPAEDFLRQIRTPIPGSNNPLYWSLESSTEMRILSWSATAGNQIEPPMLDREGARRKRGQGDTPWRVHVPAR